MKIVEGCMLVTGVTLGEPSCLSTHNQSISPNWSKYAEVRQGAMLSMSSMSRPQNCLEVSKESPSFATQTQIWGLYRGTRPNTRPRVF